MNDPSTSRRFAVVTLGCRVNQCESDAMAQQLKDRGWVKAPADGTPDLVVINTCTVTARAAMQSRQAIRRLRREHPGAVVAATGCYVQTAAEELRKIDGIDFLFGNTEKHRIPEAADGLSLKRGDVRVAVSPIDRPRPFDPVCVPMDGDRTRPVLKIQDGCNSFCTYCIVPYARGRSRSMPPTDAIAHIDKLAAAGFREVVLSGIHLGAYGADLSPATSLAALLSRIEAQTGIDRIRLSSIEPGELHSEILDLAAWSPRICPHFHVPLQSGDDRILARMGRPYTAEAFEDRIDAVRKRMPEAAIGVDVLVGFPGETDGSFQRTVDLIQRLPLTYLHVFPFSPRPGTPACGFAGKVHPAEIRKRCQRLRDLGRVKRAAYLDRLAGRRVLALVEARRDPAGGRLKATTDNYVTVLIEGPDRLKNRIVSCRILRRCGDAAVLGERLSAGDNDGRPHDSDAKVTP